MVKHGSLIAKQTVRQSIVQRRDLEGVDFELLLRLSVPDHRIHVFVSDPGPATALGPGSLVPCRLSRQRSLA